MLVSAMMAPKTRLINCAIPIAQFSASHNPSKGGPSSYDLARRKIDKQLKQAPVVKAELAKQMPRFNLLNTAP